MYKHRINGWKLFIPRSQLCRFSGSHYKDWSRKPGVENHFILLTSPACASTWNNYFYDSIGIVIKKLLNQLCQPTHTIQSPKQSRQTYLRVRFIAFATKKTKKETKIIKILGDSLSVKPSFSTVQSVWHAIHMNNKTAEAKCTAHPVGWQQAQQHSCQQHNKIRNY